MKFVGWLIYNGGMATEKFIDIHNWYVKTAKTLEIDLKPIANNQLFSQIENGQFKLAPQLDKPDFVLYLDKDIHLANQLERLGMPVFNSAHTIAVCDNKITMHQQLARMRLPQPLTIFAPMLFSQIKKPEAPFLDYVEESLSYPLVVKEAYGSFGEQVYLIHNRTELDAIATKLIHRPHLFQEYIQSSHGRDMRLHVVGDQVVASMERVSSNDFRANITNGAKMFAVEPNDRFIELAIAASQAVGADFSGVDLLFDQYNEPIICEVNSNAHIKTIYQATSIDVTEFIFKHILAKLKGHSI